ncbi:MAG: hypothetical protein HUN04_25665 [Desulfobacter sp.]|nr:MAG: hypothetical protein HUN04_25665 [Desulfobacter sp.]
MPVHKIAIPVHGDDIIPRFDLATEVVILQTTDRSTVTNKQIIVLPQSSADELCRLLLSENINTLICGAVEGEYYEFLEWKKMKIFDAVVGDWQQAFERWQNRALSPGDILSTRMVEGNLI